MKIETAVYQAGFCIAYAENECVETAFPANNPIRGTPELVINNPMTPVNSGSFWNSTLLPYCSTRLDPSLKQLITSVDKLFIDWRRLFRYQSELPIPQRPYSIDDRGLTIGAGIVQIKDYANDVDDAGLLDGLADIQKNLKLAKNAFFELVAGAGGLNYFGSTTSDMRIQAKKDVVGEEPSRKKPVVRDVVPRRARNSATA
jgi:hypothetical protein